MDFLNLAIWEVKEALAKKEFSCQELVSGFLEAIDRKDKDIHSYLFVNQECLKEAAQVDEKLARGESLRTLEGIPVAIKDNICTRHQPTTCGSRMLKDFNPPYDATVVSRLKEAGALIIGKTNMDEFAFGSSTENSAFGPTRNPHDLTRVPGGSSGGSAACVAANLCGAALGSDTGGSIRQPAAFCGVVGMKPTYGLVSRYGLVAFASSLDQIGPLTRNVRDAGLVLRVIAGRDGRDSTSVDRPIPDCQQCLRDNLKGLRIGVPKECLVPGLEPTVEEAVTNTVKAAEDLGAATEEISLPHTSYGIAVYYIVATAEASANLARFDGVKYGYRSKDASSLIELYQKTRGEGFGAEAKRRIILGTYVLSAGYYEAYYLKAQKVRTLIKQDFLNAFKKVDVILTPTTPELPFKLGEKKDDPLRMYLSDIFTVNVNLAGLPSISIPAGCTSGGLPVGVQIIGPHFGEDRIFGVASALEKSIGSPGPEN